MPTKRLSIIPEPKRVTMRNSCFPLPLKTDFTISPQCLRAECEARKIKFEKVSEEGYLLKIDKKGIKIVAATDKGLFYGKQTLAQIIGKENGGSSVRETEIFDWPDLEIRGVHFSQSINRLPFSHLKKMIKDLASYKINMVVFEYDDRFTWQKHPVISSSAALTKKEVQELVELGEKNCIQIVPLVDSLGHAEQYIIHKKYAHLRELPDQIAEMCPLNPGSLKLIKDLCSEIIPLHPSKYFHIAGDECFRLGDNCPMCRERIKKIGKAGFYLEYYSKLFDWLREKGKLPILWGDMLIKHPEAIDRFPEDIIIMDWDYRGLGSDTRPFVPYGINSNNLNALPPHIIKIFKPYWDNKYYPERFKAFPYVKFFKDKGLRVIGATSARAGGTVIPWYTNTYFNSRDFARRIAEHKQLGVVNTFWSHIPIASAWYGLLAGAEYSWSVDKTAKQRFDEKFLLRYYGLREKGIIRAMNLMETLFFPEELGETKKERLLKEKRQADEILSILKHEKRRIKKNRVMADYLELSARLKKVQIQGEINLIDARKIILGREDNYHLLDLKRYFNRSFKEWVTGGENSRDFPAGRVSFYDIPFHIATDRSKNCLMLRDKKFGKGFPERVANIKVGRKIEKFYFLHTGGYILKNLPIYKIILHFVDGTSKEKLISSSRDINDWYGQIQSLPNAFVAWRNTEGGVYLSQFINPAPEKEINSLDLVSFKNGIPIILAINGCIKEKKVLHSRRRIKQIISSLERYKKGIRSLEKEAGNLYKKIIIKEDIEGLLSSVLQKKRIENEVDQIIKELGK